MRAPEPENIAAFKAWLIANGASIHPDVYFEPATSGFNIIASNDITADTTVVSIPFTLAITPEVSRIALTGLLSNELQGWSERQLVCTYVCMHWFADLTSSTDALKHIPYINALPSPDKLRTPLHFSPNELQAFQGSNLYGATLDRRQAWEVEWSHCKDFIELANATWSAEFTWKRYLTASTYLSSRAFPSTLLSSTPSLVATSTSHPVLLPGIDALNHARGHPVSWVVSASSTNDRVEPSISLVIHTQTLNGSEILNNYGPKPNSELILGYGFSLPNNPDDTIVLKIGGRSAVPPPALSSSSNSQPSPGKWEVGRNARGVEPVWEAVLAATRSQGAEDEQPSSDAENQLFAAQTLVDMAEHLYDRLPLFPPVNAKAMRPEVLIMLEHYLEGQRDILRAVVAFAREKESQAIETLRELGLDIIAEEEDA